MAIQSAEVKAFDQVATLIANSGIPYATLTLNPLPISNGISFAPAGGATETTFATRDAVCYSDVVLNAKHSNRQTAFDTLSRIHEMLTKLKVFTAGSNYEIIGIGTISSPQYLSEGDNGQYLFGSSLRINYYRR